MTKTQIVNSILSLNSDKTASQLMRMHKETLETLLISLQSQVETVETNQMTTEDKFTVAHIKSFDLSKYENFNPNSMPMSMRVLGISAGQLNIISALENNFKVKISHAASRYEMSVKIQKVFKAIEAGTVQRRTDEEILARVKAYKAVKPSMEEQPATSAQIAKINSLEKATGIANTTIVKNKLVASQIIAKYIEILNAKPVQEVAVTEPTTIETKLRDKNFCNKFIKILKSMFA